MTEIDDLIRKYKEATTAEEQERILGEIIEKQPRDPVQIGSEAML
jgi:hypothetical protein